MTVLALPVRRPMGAWGRHGGALAAGAGAVLLLFARDAGDLAALWWTSTTYGHCLFVGPVAAWLVWQRRDGLARVEPAAWWPGLAAVAAGGAGWMLGEAGGVALARQLGLLLMLEGAVAALLGPRVVRALLFPLAYAVFLVPFGEEIEPPLQAVTVGLAVPILHLAGVPAVSDGVLIHAGRYWFEVAEACSGSKFVLAMLAFGVLVANQCFRAWPRRLLFVGACVAVPVLANGVRAAATMLAADLWGVEAATGVDHVVFGWVFFGAVMGGVLALGWRWFDRSPDAPFFDPDVLRGPGRSAAPLLPVALGVLAVAAVFPAWAARGVEAPPLAAPLPAPAVPGWRVVPAPPGGWRPWHPGSDRQLRARYRAARGAVVDLDVALYRDQREGRELAAFGTGVLREDDRWRRVADLAPVAGGRAVRIVAPGPDGGPVERVVASWYRLPGVVTADPRRVKLEAALARLSGRPAAGAAVYVSAQGPGAEATVRRFVGAGDLPARAADRVSGTR